MQNVIVGTSGHVDHGKTCLIKAQRFFRYGHSFYTGIFRPLQGIGSGDVGHYKNYLAAAYYPAFFRVNKGL